MPLHVEREVVASGERPGAQVALERLLAGVFPVVPGQLIGPGKLPAAALPGAGVRLLSSVGPLVSFQVRALGVDLQTVLGMYSSVAYKTGQTLSEPKVILKSA